MSLGICTKDSVILLAEKNYKTKLIDLSSI